MHRGESSELGYRPRARQQVIPPTELAFLCRKCEDPDIDDGHQASSSVQDTISLHGCRGDLHLRSWLCMIESLAVDQLLRITYTDQYIFIIFPPNWKFLPIDSDPALILMSIPKVVLPLDENI